MTTGTVWDIYLYISRGQSESLSLTDLPTINFCCWKKNAAAPAQSQDEQGQRGAGESNWRAGSRWRSIVDESSDTAYHVTRCKCSASAAQG